MLPRKCFLEEKQKKELGSNCIIQCKNKVPQCDTSTQNVRVWSPKQAEEK